MFRSQQIITRDYVYLVKVTELFLKNTEFKILKIIPGVMAAKRVEGISGDPCASNAQHHTGHHVYLLQVLLP